MKICRIGVHIATTVQKQYISSEFILIVLKSFKSCDSTPKIGLGLSLEVSRPAAVMVTIRMTISPAEQNGALTSWQGYPGIFKAAYLVY